MRRLQTLFLTVFILAVFSNSANANTKHSIGFGVQYAGLIGYQFNMPLEHGSWRTGIGIFGISTGYDHILSSKVSLGVQGFFTMFGDGGGINLNYHFSNVRSSGWMLGWDVYAAQSDLSRVAKSTYKGFTFLSFGYKF